MYNVLANTSLNPLPDEKILDSSKLKEFADDNFKFDENGRKLSKRAENTVGKVEIARYEQFLLFPQCFQKVCFPGASKGVIVLEWVNCFDDMCNIFNHNVRKKMLIFCDFVYLFDIINGKLILRNLTFLCLKSILQPRSAGNAKLPLSVTNRSVIAVFYDNKKSLICISMGVCNTILSGYTFCISMGECNTILSAYTKYRHFG